MERPCPRCGQPVLWLPNHVGVAVPLEPEPDPEGHFVLVDGKARVVPQDIPGFPGYRVGDDGSVWSCWRLAGGRATRRRVLAEQWKRLKTTLATGYPRLTLIDAAGERHDLHVHILVLTAFIGPRPDPSMQGRHLDDVPTNNCLRNLSWGTPAENWEDSRRNGNRQLGEGVHNAKATAELVVRIRAAIASGETLRSVSGWSGLSIPQVHAIKARKVWRHVP